MTFILGWWFIPLAFAVSVVISLVAQVKCGSCNPFDGGGLGIRGFIWQCISVFLLLLAVTLAIGLKIGGAS